MVISFYTFLVFYTTSLVGKVSIIWLFLQVEGTRQNEKLIVVCHITSKTSDFLTTRKSNVETNNHVYGRDTPRRYTEKVCLSVITPRVDFHYIDLFLDYDLGTIFIVLQVYVKVVVKDHRADTEEPYTRSTVLTFFSRGFDLLRATTTYLV